VLIVRTLHLWSPGTVEVTVLRGLRSTQRFACAPAVPYRSSDKRSSLITLATFGNLLELVRDAPVLSRARSKATDAYSYEPMKGHPRSCPPMLRAKRRAVYVGGGIFAIALALATLRTSAWIRGAGRRSTMEVRAQKVGHTASAMIPESEDDELTLATNTTVTLVCELRGETGNMLSNLAYCVGLASWVEAKHGIQADVLPRHKGKDGARWSGSLKEIRTCLPNVAKMDFELARTQQFAAELDVKTANQAQSGLSQSRIDSNNPAVVERRLDELASYARLIGLHFSNESTPYLTAKGMLSLDNNYLLDRYFDDIEALFLFDYDACCAVKPELDETVFVRACLELC
jgi:hypothetical protein